MRCLTDDSSSLTRIHRYSPYFYIQDCTLSSAPCILVIQLISNLLNPIDAIENGVSRNLAFYALSILNAASVFGRIIPNVCQLSLNRSSLVLLTLFFEILQWLADTYGPLTILIPNCILSGILIFLFLPMCRTAAGVVVFSILFGFASGACQFSFTLIPTVVLCADSHACSL